MLAVCKEDPPGRLEWAKEEETAATQRRALRGERAFCFFSQASNPSSGSCMDRPLPPCYCGLLGLPSKGSPRLTLGQG